MLGALRPLLPRLYSISSSQLEAPGRVAATVAVVRYESLNRRRIGVTSTQLAERLQARDPLQTCLWSLHRARLPSTSTDGNPIQPTSTPHPSKVKAGQLHLTLLCLEPCMQAMTSGTETAS